MSENIFIVNSYMWIHSFYANELPNSGETFSSKEYRSSGGGKGINQAFAAAYEGANVQLIGRVGEDAPGHICEKQCNETGIGTRYLQFDEKVGTGCAGIFYDEHGGNAILVYPGAGDRFCIGDVTRAEEYIRTCKIGGFQFEVNVSAVFSAIRLINKWGVETFVDPSPATEIPLDVYPFITYIKPNEHEASVLTGINVTNRENASKAGRWLLEKGVQKAAIITLGEQGCMVVSREGERFFPALKVKVMDSTCAGDSFAGGFIAGIADGKSLYEATIQAMCLAILTVTRQGSMYNCFFDSREKRGEIEERYRHEIKLAQ